jgi:hypothetical protein
MILVKLRGESGQWAGVLQLHVEPTRSGSDQSDENGLQGSRLELVEVAAASWFEQEEAKFCSVSKNELHHPERPKKSLKYEYYYVMWISRSGEVAYRQGLGRVEKNIWEAQKRENIHLRLG